MADTLRSNFRLRPSEHRALLLVGDLVASTAAVFASLYVWRQYLLQNLIDSGIKPHTAEILVNFNLHIPFWFYLLPLGWLLLMAELYEPHTAARWRKTFRGIAVAAFIGLVVYALIFITNKEANLPRIGVGAFLVFASLLTLSWRALFIRFYTATGQQRRVLIVGAGKAGRTLAQIYNQLHPPPFVLIGFIDDDVKKTRHAFDGFPVIGTSKKLLDIVEDYHISDLVTAINRDLAGSTFQTILDAQERGIEVTRMPILYEEIAQRVPIHHLESDWLIRSFVYQLRVSIL